jgi:hypothetical protein
MGLPIRLVLELLEQAGHPYRFEMDTWTDGQMATGAEGQ